MKILLTFPGQGPQRPGMLQGLPDGDAILSQASEVLGEPAAQLDSADALRHTRAVQLCLLIAGTAHARDLLARGLTPDMVCGLSIGAFPAAVAAGALTFDDALRLVALRGELMEQAYPEGYGLTAVVGLSLNQLEPLLGEETWIANINAERQLVIAGSEAAMQAVAQKALDAGAEKAHRLRVSVPSHCVLLAEPAKKLAAAFADVTLERPRFAYMSGSSARVLWQPAQIAEDLAFNMSRTVRWHEAMVAANEREVQLAIEMPPGAVLTGLTRQAFTAGEVLSLEQGGTTLALTLAKRLRHAR
ncbi:malonate decarboxylase subunit epsilon [Erwinia sp. 9145]|uniref:malonate decarboxylase subunit epsilon n=1 Tax=Erwinia sp. 9145 TaxID=1500895 RepID=UPI000550D9E9|nr:malonate decarboxylase subunit epsilon [Erwinia sp. 9145]